MLWPGTGNERKGTDLPVVMQLRAVQFWMSAEEVKIGFAALRSIKRESLF